MAYISNYNPSIHDLYTYNSGPTIDPQNYSNNQQVTPISYNNSLYIKDSHIYLYLKHANMYLYIKHTEISLYLNKKAT